jgi:O-antigen ligase
VGIVGVVLGAYVVTTAYLPQRWALLALVVVVFPFVAMVAGGVQRLLLAIVIIDIPLQMDVYLGYREDIAALGTVGGLNLSVTTLCLAILYAVWLAEQLAGHSTPPRPLLRVSLPFLGYLGAVVASAAVAREYSLAGFQIFLLVQMFLLYVYVVHAVRSRQGASFVVAMLLVGLVVVSLVIIGVRLVGHDISVGGITARIDGYGRVSGLFGTPNAVAGYLSLLLAPAASVLLTGLPFRYKWLAACAFAVGTAAMILTQSRGGWVAFVLSMAVLCLASWRRRWLSATLLIVLVVIVVPLFVTLQPTLFPRLTADDAGSADSRVPLDHLALRMIKDKPVLGVGANGFAAMMDRYASPEIANDWLFTVHNNYLLIGAETGLIGLAAFLWLLLVTLRRGWAGSRMKDRLLSPLALGLAAAVMGHMAHMYVDFFNQRPQLQLLWLVAGLITAIHLIGEEGATSVGDARTGVPTRYAGRESRDV